MKLIKTARGRVYLHVDVWDLVDTMGPDNSTYRRYRDYVVFEGQTPSEVAAWIFRLASQAKTEILTIFLQDAPDKESMHLLALLMEDLEAYLGGFEGSLYLYWLTGEPNAKMEAMVGHKELVAKLDVAMHQRKTSYRTFLNAVAKDCITEDTQAHA